MLRHSRCYLTAFACCPAGFQFLPCGSNSFYKHTTNHINVPWREIRHMENSPITQTTPEPTLFFLGGWPREKNFPHPWPHCKPGLIALIGPLRPYCSQTLWSCSGMSRKPNLLKTCVGLETDIRIAIPSTLHIGLKVEWNFLDQY